MAHLSPSVVFSPSVARQQLATAKDWNYVDRWLTTKFGGRSAPAFERNNDTLKALLALAALNENADEECALLARSEAKSLQDLQVREAAEPNKELFGSIESHLAREGQVALDVLSSTAALLNVPLAETEPMVQRILDEEVTSCELEQASDRVSALQKKLLLELEQITGLVDDLRCGAYQPAADLSKESLDFQRKSKLLAARLPDLRSRLMALSGGINLQGDEVQNVKDEEDDFRALLTVVNDLESQVKGFHGLPHDVDLARLELESLKVQLKELTRRRDAIFEGLVERESPEKIRSTHRRYHN
jgi:HAUS augmin-like complex subunit 1